MSKTNDYQKVDSAKSNKIHPTDEKSLGQLSKRKILANNSNPELEAKASNRDRDGDDWEFEK